MFKVLFSKLFIEEHNSKFVFSMEVSKEILEVQEEAATF